MSLQQLNEDGEAKMAENSPILATIDADEAHRPRAGLLASAIKFEGHFLIGKVENLSHDVRFQWMGHTLNVELKDFSSDGQSDHVNSIINSEGRLYRQILTARETEDPLVIVVLGGDAEVASAIARNVFSRGFLGAEAEDKINEYTRMVEVFEANCEGCNIRVWRMLDNPFGRLLQKVRKILQGGDFSAFRPHPAEGERKSAALSLHIGNVMGPARAEAILEKFNLILQPKRPDACLCDCKGIGPKLESHIQEALELPDEVVARQAELKAGRARAQQGGKQDSRHQLNGCSR
jgi:hypothetical protein